MSAVEQEALAIRLKPRSKYLSLASMSVQRIIAYRTTTLMNLIASLISVAVAYYLWRTIYASRAQVGALSWDQMRTYILLVYAINALVSVLASFRLMNLIRSGEIAIELLRPIDFLKSQLALTLGATLVEGLLSVGVALAMGFLIFDIQGPHTALAGALFMISVGLGFLIKFLVVFLVALLCFWTMSHLGLIWTQNAVINLFSGALIPLELFPGWLRTTAAILPFQGIISTPVRIYLGQLQGADMAWALLVQALWVAALWKLSRLAWGPAMRSLKIQGG
jgi:ABC-2 type transport system permease protein